VFLPERRGRCATAWLDADQQARIMQDTGCEIDPISGGCFTAIVSPEGGRFL
jgi:nitrilase